MQSPLFCFVVYLLLFVCLVFCFVLFCFCFFPCLHYRSNGIYEIGVGGVCGAALHLSVQLTEVSEHCACIELFYYLSYPYWPNCLLLYLPLNSQI